MKDNILAEEREIVLYYVVVLCCVVSCREVAIFVLQFVKRTDHNFLSSKC